MEVFAPGPAHTPDNVVVWLPTRALLFGGCMIRPTGARALGDLADADVAAWPASALRVEERNPAARVVVPSHGDPGNVTLLAATTSLAHALLPGDARIRREVQLPMRDGTTVTVCGTYGTRNLAPHGPPVTKPALARDEPDESDAGARGYPVAAREGGAIVSRPHRFVWLLSRFVQWPPRGHPMDSDGHPVAAPTRAL